MTGTPQRRRLLQTLADGIPPPVGDACVLVGVDGPDGAGKTVLADELAEAVRRGGRPALRVSVDDFHHVRAHRYRSGRASPVGFLLDSFDLDRLASYVLDPLGPTGDRWYRPAGHDLRTDTVLDPPTRRAPAGAVVVVDGLFLHRPELVGRWGWSVYLDVPVEVTAARMAVRDGTPADPTHPAMARYVEAQRIYRSVCEPLRAADVVVDNADVSAPVVVPAPSGPGDRSARAEAGRRLAPYAGVPAADRLLHRLLLDPDDSRGPAAAR